VSASSAADLPGAANGRPLLCSGCLPSSASWQWSNPVADRAAPLLEIFGSEALAQHVRIADELLEVYGPMRRAQVDGDGLLVAGLAKPRACVTAFGRSTEIAAGIATGGFSIFSAEAPAFTHDRDDLWRLEKAPLLRLVWVATLRLWSFRLIKNLLLRRRRSQLAAELVRRSVGKG
jgi:hypothetical protein